MTTGRAAPRGSVVVVICVVALAWSTLLVMVVARWPRDAAAWVALTGALALLAVLARLLGRRLLRDREAREHVRDVVLVGSLTVAAAATIYATAVLVIAGRPPAVATDASRAALVAAVLAAASVLPVSRALWRWTRRVLSDAGRPRRELLEQFGRRLAGMLPIDETVEQLAESLRPACAAAAAEVWRWDGRTLWLAAASPGRSAAPIAIAAEHAALIGRAGVSGAGWVDSWLPVLHRGGGPVRVAPLAVQGALVGLLVVHRDASAEDFDDGDDEALARVARLVAAVLHNAELDGELRRTVDDLRRSNDELRSSRARLVTVADAERRRLERDLHDGAQAELAAVAVKVQLTRALLDADPAAVPGVLDEIEGALRDATVSLRALAHGIFPPLLLTGGLADALAGFAAHSPAEVSIGRMVRGRFEREIEAAVYFCCVEAVHNAVKHAGPGAHVTVDVDATDGQLTFTVIDDGTGFDEHAVVGGHGFTNMVDRLGAIGGTLTVTSCPGAGTRVRGSLATAVVGEISGSAR